ncbi:MULTISPECIES: 2-succinyl-5-enolpyruvyl-6-hydroxy-3-cyclohexene-1-carboxylic-acid synthase [unclassified Nocardioides]|uniref:2-succinyl-5-enolpyruvyl-6-hydroxy-3- cyclohexene-1-carboxylic-acid synthase n=1 Tax=unclassified Nocardioides TaxID=2615069 RepID=UPI0009EFBF7D|nr:MULTISPECIES: 2-succinyl-5-enolpyruvyl-6-hydroxy-3-cyclohexene-1-carboxylic-acid synthase [unclassified Nocardioides]GAW48858.1 2-succinyl-6-hydroxy-2, 4-cyclohexadiene-1-carboxylate synthase [Nocardioides sp. PD653-B2]GAW54495.1 2-succinyl-6-hydroxy-2, 4-cyclohexadiene-1-carboxylate synthase [Nocardioides sp. PD653]
MSSTQLARAVVTALVEAGVTEIVIAPGSRNAPLSFASYDAAAAGLVRLHTRIDERSAGFLALGLTRNHARAAVICTSGTGVANLHPAVLEAAHTGLPLVVVTADRPARLRGTNANQTTDQVGIFGPLVATLDLADTGPDPVRDLGVLAPVHLNVQLDEPLLPDDTWAPDVTPGRAPHRVRPVSFTELPLGPRTVVVAGDDAGPPARVLAEKANWPLLAEPSSGSRTGENAVRTYRLLLDGDLGQRIERVVVCGHPTLSRPVSRLVARTDVQVVVAGTDGVWTRPAFPYDGEIVRGGFGVREADDPAWLHEWQAADRATGRHLDALLAADPDLTPHEVARAVARALPAGGLLIVGASSPIRDLDLMVPRYEVGARRKVIANRGLSGIDGTVSTAIGAALARDSSRALALMGDVTFLHDSNGLVIGPDEPVPDLMIVVVNDDGGSIFAMLEQGDPAYADRYDRLFGTPHHVDLASLCAATRTPHWRVDALAELEHALANPNGGIEVVEVVVRRDNRRDLDARIRALRP